MDWFRRKEKDSTPTATDGSNARAYYDEKYTSSFLDTNGVTFSELLALPPGMNDKEWRATTIIALYKNTTLLYSTINEYCMASPMCGVMCGPNSAQFIWNDEKGRKTKFTASQFVDQLMSASQKLIENESIFPTLYGKPFSGEFDQAVRTILRHIYQVLAHLYAAHFDHFVKLELVPHLNMVARHAFAFNSMFRVLNEKDVEYACLQELSAALLKQP